MAKKDSFTEEMIDFLFGYHGIWVFVLIITGIVFLFKGCPKKPVEQTKIERTINIIDKKWEKWIEEHEK